MESSHGVRTSDRASMPSAQRLAASMESSHEASVHQICALGTVLNALRHQWNHHVALAAAARLLPGDQCSTPCGINGIITTGVHLAIRAAIAVLNALRHQWNHHHRHCEIQSDYGTAVLNALRHQWNHHEHVLVTPTIANILCSTPCGINGIITLTCVADGSSAGIRAQRLAASMESSRCWHRRDVTVCCRCSTPCGINGIITSVLTTVLGTRWCSTPCGINGIITVTRALSRAHIRCSTPCGINGSSHLVRCR